MLFAFIRFDFWFQSKTHRTKNEVELRCRLDSEDLIWPIALAKEQLAAITKHWFHGIPFRFELELMVRRLLAPVDSNTRGTVVVLKTRGASLVGRQGRQNLPHFQMRADGRPRSGAGKFSRQPLWQWEVDGHGIGLVDGFWGKLAARVGLAPTPRGLTGRRATLTPPGNRNWRCRQDLHLHGFV